MRNMLFILAVVLLSSCKTPEILNIDKYPMIREPFDTAWQFVSSHKYMSHPYSSMKDPEQFEHDGGGNCADFAANLVYHLGPEACYLSIDKGKTTHAIVKYKGLYIEPQKYNIYYTYKCLDIRYEISYAEIIYLWSIYN